MKQKEVNGKTFKAKPKVTRNPLFLDEKYLGSEPVWDAAECETMSPEVRASRLQAAFRYYNYFYNQKDLKKYEIGRAHV